MQRREFLTAAAAALTLPVSTLARAAAERRLLYIAQPGIRNYESYGGVGVLVYDIGDGYRFVKRIPTWNLPAGRPAENVKGIAASARTGRLYVSTIRRLGCIDLRTERCSGTKELEGGCDRMSISPDGQILYVPSLERAALERRRRYDRRRSRKNCDEFRRAQHALFARRLTRVPRRPALAAPFDRRHEDAHGRADRRTVRGVDSSVHRQRRADDLLRQHQRAARLRGRRHHDGQEAASGRGQRREEGPGRAAWLPEPRHRSDARRARALGLRRPQQPHARLRQHRHAASADHVA